MRRNPLVRLSLALLLASGSSVFSFGVAAPATTPQKPRAQAPIQIEADRAEITEQSGLSIYSGKVNLKQGDLEMQGERLEVQRDAQTGNLRAVLTGSPARLRQPSDAGEMVNANASRITYVSSEKSIDLQGSAEFVRGRDRVTGQSIRYDANAKKLLASGAAGGGGGRVQIVIQPEQESPQPQNPPEQGQSR